MNKSKENIARGIICKEDKILLCKNIARGYYFLPGGHIEMGESSEDALKREFIEESGTLVIDTKFIETFHNEFQDSERIIQESLDIHLIKINMSEVRSKESHIGFYWLPLKDLLITYFLPTEMIPRVIDITKKNSNFWA